MKDFREKIDKGKSDLITNIQSVITARKITSIGICFLMLGLIGIFQFITLGCNFNQLLTWEFYLTLIYRSILVFLSYYIAVNFLYDKCINHPDIQNAIKEFKLLTKVRDINFSEFLDNIYNPRRKKEAWKIKINDQIIKLERKSIKSSEKKSKKILEKINQLKYMLTDEYIDPRINTLNVSYYKVLESDFLGTDVLDGNDNMKTRIDYDKTVFKSIIKKIGPYILMSIVMGAMVTGAINKPAYEIIINLIADLMIILMRIVQGAWDTPKIINSSYLVPYRNRINILKEYIEWCANIPKSKSYILVSKLEEETENKEGE